MSERKRAQRILQILSNEFGIPKWTGSKREPFQTLIGTVLSQATNDRNRDQAYANLVKRFEIDPKELASADVKEIEKAIRVGGLYRNKASKIKALSKTVLKEFNGSPVFIFSWPLGEEREMFVSISGGGATTTD